MLKERLIRVAKGAVLACLIAIGTMGAQCDWRGRGRWENRVTGWKCVETGDECEIGRDGMIEFRVEF